MDYFPNKNSAFNPSVWGYVLKNEAKRTGKTTKELLNFYAAYHKWEKSFEAEIEKELNIGENKC